MLDETLTYQDLAARWKSLRATHDARVREVAAVGAPRTLLCVELGDSSQPCVYLSAGVHGDEPAGIVALLLAVENRELDTRFSYRIWPCMNPTGFEARTRESVDGLDINRTFGRGGGSPEAKAIVMANRDRKYVLAADLHEDDEAGGFYAYAYGESGAAERALESVARGGFAIDRRGVLRPDPAAEAIEIGGLSLSLLLCRNASRRTVTFETASARALHERVDVHRLALSAAIGELARSLVDVEAAIDSEVGRGAQ